MRAAALLLTLAAAALGPSLRAAPPESTPAADRMEWWREARFGLFLHWGLYSIPAGAWRGRTDHGEWIRTTAEIPLEEYEKFRDQFDPVEFDADRWAELAANAGMKYVVITSKHHDGFCLFDSKHTEWDVMATPFRRDVLKELAEACRKRGLKMCWYHSIMDWHHPDYLPRRDWEQRPATGADFERFTKYLRAQVTELLTNYGEIGVMWFDGEWEATWDHAHGQSLYDLCRTLQPNVIVNNRVDKGRAGMAGLTVAGEFAGDYGTPEQEVPATGFPGVDWETCMTMNDHWGYNAADQRWKGSGELIRLLIDIASKGGNFLLNVGPTAAGEFPAASIERLEAIGRWMKVNGEAIHGTTASPVDRPAWGRVTAREDGAATRLYLHVFEWPSDGMLRLGGVGNRPLRAWLLAEPEAKLAVARDQDAIEIRLPATAPDSVATVVCVEVAGRPIVYRPPVIVAPADILVDHIDVEIGGSSSELELRFTVDGSDPGPDSPRVENPITLSDSCELRVRAFHLGQPVSAAAARTFRRVEPLPAATTEFAEFPHEGLDCDLWRGAFERVADFASAPPVETERVPELALPPGLDEENVARRFRAWFGVARDEVYVFSLLSDDGSQLWIDGQLVVDHDGLHGAEAKQGQVALAFGYHELTVLQFNRTGGADLRLFAAPIGDPLAPFPPGAFRCK